MNEEQLKAFLIRDKVFLKQIYNGPNLLKNKTVLLSAEENEINTLLKYLHFVANGKITITKKNFDEIKKAKKLTFLQQKVEKTSNLLKLLNANRKVKIAFILKLSSILPNLLYGLFNLI